MNPAELEAFTAPKNPRISTIPHEAAKLWEETGSKFFAALSCGRDELASVRAELAAALAELAKYEPANLEGELIEWPGTPFHLDVKGRQLRGIYRRGEDIFEQLPTSKWDEAQEWLLLNTESTSAAIARRASLADMQDERAERAA